MFSFSSITPHPVLQPFVAKILVFGSSGRLPDADRKLIVPNANLKLTLTCRNGMVARVGDKTFKQQEHVLSLTGLVDIPVMLDPLHDIATDTIVIEFNPLGAYRFFRISYSEAKNQIPLLEDLAGKEIRPLQQQLADAETLNGKLDLLQRYLIHCLQHSSPDLIYDHCIQRISVAEGSVTVKQLEKETGYSARWLNRKFAEHLGTSPKNLAEIIRFREFYRVYATGADLHTLKSHLYGHYYDQSHFLRAFKRFTGATPTELQQSINELATRHYVS